VEYGFSTYLGLYPNIDLDPELMAHSVNDHYEAGVQLLRYATNGFSSGRMIRECLISV
jgi:hypothetical protein